MQRRPTAKAPCLLLFTLALLELSCARVSNNGTHPSKRLYPVALQGRWGYMDLTGTVRIKPAFDEADAFVEERARVSVNKKLGFIDPDGTFVARPQFEAAASFHEGLARVKIGDKWGFIDKAGQVVIQPMFGDNGAIPDAGSFYEGLARMSVGADLMRLKWGFIDRTGKFAINPAYDGAWIFENGIAAVEVAGKLGFVNKKGDLIAAPQFDNSYVLVSFADGLAAVKLKDKYGYVDGTGQLVINPQFEMANPFQGGFATAAVGTDCSAENYDHGEWIRNQKFDCRWGVIDKAGRFVVQPEYTDAGPFADGLAPAAVGSFCSVSKVKNLDGKEVENFMRDCRYGYLNSRAQMVISPQFDHAGEFQNGYAAVTMAGSFGLIDRSGRYFVNPVYDGAAPFDGELAAVLQGKEIKYLDRKGHFVQPHLN
jgi:hypothetical protein